jgi:hypothetical protein
LRRPWPELVAAQAEEGVQGAVEPQGLLPAERLAQAVAPVPAERPGRLQQVHLLAVEHPELRPREQQEEPAPRVAEPRVLAVAEEGVAERQF